MTDWLDSDSKQYCYMLITLHTKTSRLHHHQKLTSCRARTVVAVLTRRGLASRPSCMHACRFMILRYHDSSCWRSCTAGLHWTCRSLLSYCMDPLGRLCCCWVDEEQVVLCRDVLSAGRQVFTSTSQAPSNHNLTHMAKQFIRHLSLNATNAHP